MLNNVTFAHLQWQDKDSLQAFKLPANIQNWLFEQGSLTVKLKQHCACFEVKVQSEQWIYKTYQNETALLTDKQYWCREVLLYGDGEPWVAARTLISAPLLNQYQTLLQLGNTPIGEWLFQQPLTRQKMQWAQDEKTQLYARRCLFSIRKMPLLVSELFLENSPITR